MKPITVGSLFSGIGGFELGLEWASDDRVIFKTVFQVENDPYAIRVLERHWPDVRRWGDVRTFPPDTAGESMRLKEQSGRLRDAGLACPSWYVDLICGGFPCQPVSCAGKRAGDADARWLWPEFARVVRILRPRWVVAENVSGLLSVDAGRIFGVILRDLAEIGYDAEWDCIPAAAVGAPHIRDRVFLLARRQRSSAKPRCGGVLADTGCLCEFDEGQPALSRPDSSGVGQGGQNVADANQIGRNGRAGMLGQGWGRQLTDGNWWAVEPAVCQLADGVSPGLVRYAGRTATGVPNRVNKLRCLGNAVVPAVVRLIAERIKAMEHELAGT